MKTQSWQRLLELGSCLFERAGTEHAGPLHPLLESLYDEFNGGFFWGRALLIRPLTNVAGAPRSISDWNAPALWKSLYGVPCDAITFFAEDAFGVQIGVRAGRIVQFDPETAWITDLADSPEQWIDQLLGDPAYHTGAPVLTSWEKEHGPIAAGCRLVPKTLFFLGGEFESENMVCRADVEGLRIRAQLWEATRHLPDGSKIVFTVG